MRVLAICGSLRRSSHNRKLLQAAARELPNDVAFELFQGLGDLPHYDEDADVELAHPAVRRLRDALARADAVLPANPYEVAQSVVDFVPGAQTPAHTHPGQVFVTVLEGAITFRTGGTEKVYKVGESFIEPPGVVVTGVNTGTTRTMLLLTYLLSKGAPPAAPVATPAPPATGNGGNLPGMPNTGAGGGGDRLPLGWLVLLAGGALAAGGTLLRRRARRA